MGRLRYALMALAIMATAFCFVSSPVLAEDEKKPLKIGYSDWTGWVAWQVAIDKGWFKEAGVEVEFQWMDYVASMNAYVAEKLDAVCMTNGDALVTGGGEGGRASVGIIINDFSNGNDMIVAAPGIESIKDLKGKKIGVEEGFVSHLLVLTALEKHGLKASDVEIVNTPTDKTPALLKSGAVQAIAAWQPNSGQALKSVAGSKAIFTSADAPGIIYDLLYVSKESLTERRDDWAKVVEVWYRTADFIRDEANRDEVLKIMSARVNLTPAEYEPFFKGTYILNLEESMVVWKKGDKLNSIYGSSSYVDNFNVKFGVYKKPLNVDSYLDPSLTKEFALRKRPSR